MQVKIKVFIKIVIIRTERDERILSDHLFFEKRAKAYKTLYCGDIGDAGISSAALVSRGPTEIFCLTELFII